MPQKYRSLPDMLLARIAATPDRKAFMYPSEGSWVTITWREAGERVRAVALGLLALGLKPEERCAILSNTRMEWLLADLGILSAAGATTTIYPSTTGAECSFVINDSETVVAFVEDDDQVAKLAARRPYMPSLRKVINFTGQAGHDGWVMTLDELMALGRARGREHPDEFETVARGVRPDQLATLIYTSGTTGRPKGVELIHDCWLFEGEAIDHLHFLNIDDCQYLWLPLAHSFGKVLEVAQLQVGFLTAVDGRVDKLVENLAVIKPTLICAVPRILEKVRDAAVKNAKQGSAVTAKVFTWAMATGRKVSEHRQRTFEDPTGLLWMQFLAADRLVFSKLKARFGGRLRFFISGGAPLAREVAEFFHAADVLVLEGYGLTETSAASFLNLPRNYRFGTVGLPFPGNEVKIADPDPVTGEGEILVRGRGVMRAYHNLPDVTREALDAEGWMHTGDIGLVERTGHLRITDRKKDLIKTSGGKYVAPQALEGSLKARSPLIHQILVHGNNRKFCSALITIEAATLKDWAGSHGLGGLSYAELIHRPEVVAEIQAAVDDLNAGLPSFERIKKFAILPGELTEEAGEVTASLKLKRKIVEQKYQSMLDSFYEEPSGSSSGSGAG